MESFNYATSSNERIIYVNAHKNLYQDVLAFISKFEHLINSLEYLLLWKDRKKSIAFYIFVHLFFWAIVLMPFNKLFILSSSVLLYSIIEFIDRKFHFSGALSFTKDYKPVFSKEELSKWISYIIIRAFSLVNKIMPFRKRHPLIFYILALLTGYTLIYFGSYFNGTSLSYSLINILLAIPAILYNNLHVKFLKIFTPWIKKLEAEFDRKQLEDPVKRDAEEAEFWNNITYKGKRVAENVDSLWPSKWTCTIKTEDGDSETSSIDGDRSENIFINDFISLKDKRFYDHDTIDSLASELVGQEEAANDKISQYINDLLYESKSIARQKMPRKYSDTDEEILKVEEDGDDFDVMVSWRGRRQ